MTNAENAELTKENIVNAMFSLMSENEFETITITKIAEKTGIGRATLYRYFQTKEQILKYYFSKHAAQFVDIASIRTDSKDDYYEIIFRVFSMLKSNCRLIQLIQKAKLEVIYLDFLNEGMVENFKRNNYPYAEYAPYYFAGSLFNVSMQWVKNDCKDSVKHISDIFLNQLFVDVIKFDEPGCTDEKNS